MKIPCIKMQKSSSQSQSGCTTMLAQAETPQMHPPKEGGDSLGMEGWSVSTCRNQNGLPSAARGQQ